MLFSYCYLFYYFFVAIVVIVIDFGYGQELKQDSPGSKFNLKCPDGTYVTNILSTFSDSGDDHRIYKVKCSPLPTKGATKCKPGSETDFLKDFSIGCSGNEYLAGIESTDFKNQDRKFRATCCTTENLSVKSSSCTDLATRGTTGFNAAAPKDQVFQKFDSKYVLSKQNGNFMSDRSFVFSTCGTTQDSSNTKSSEPSGGSPPSSKNPSDTPPKSAAPSSSSGGNRNSNSQSGNLPEKKSVVGTNSEDSKSNSKNSNPPSPSKSSSNSNPPSPSKSSSNSNPLPSKSSPSQSNSNSNANSSQSKSKSNSSPNSGSHQQLKERPKTSDSSSSSSNNPTPNNKPAQPPKSQNSGRSPSSSSNSGNANSLAAKKIANANQKSKGGKGDDSGKTDNGDYLPETVAFQPFDTRCPKGSAIRNIKIKRVDQGSKRDAIFALKCEKLPDYIDSNDIEDQVLGYTAKKDGSVQSPCNVTLGQFMCGIKGEYDENRGVEAHCCRVKDTFPSFRENPQTVTATENGGVLKSDTSKDEFVGNLDQLPDGTFVGQMVAFGKLFVVKGNYIQTDDGCRCKCNCQCSKRNKRSIIKQSPRYVFTDISQLRHKRQDCSGQCECKCVIQNC